MFAARLIKPSAAAAALRTTSQLCARPAARSVRLFSMGPIGKATNTHTLHPFATHALVSCHVYYYQCVCG